MALAIVWKKQRLMIVLAMMVILTGLAPLHAGAAAASSAPATVQVESQPIRLVFDGKELTLPKGLYAFLYQGRTYIPIRYLSYALLKQVDWDGTKNEVKISEPTKEQLAELKKQLLMASGGKTSQEKRKLTMKVKEAKLLFDGKTKALPKGQTMFIHDSSIYVPLRFLAESIGTKVEWDPVTKTVSGKSKAYQASEGDGEDGEAPGKDGVEAPGGNGAVPGAGGGSGGGGGGVPGKATYEQITSSAESRLYSLQAACESTLFDTVLQYPSADEAGKAAVIEEIYAEIAACTADFERIISETTSALTEGGYSTAIIADYRAAFEAALAAGRKLVEGL